MDKETKYEFEKLTRHMIGQFHDAEKGENAAFLLALGVLLMMLAHDDVARWLGVAAGIAGILKELSRRRWRNVTIDMS